MSKRGIYDRYDAGTENRTSLDYHYWTVCYLAFGLIPGLRSTFMPYITHINVGPVETIFTLGNFIIGFILWNAAVAAGIALAGLLNNYIKD